jgi:hypothetical protein
VRERQRSIQPPFPLPPCVPRRRRSLHEVYEVGKVIGKGGFATVRNGRKRSTKDEVRKRRCGAASVYLGP